MKYSLLLAFVCFLGNTSLAQECNSILLGQVVDFHDNTPLDGATILITGKQNTSFTDFDGKFKFENLCNGVLELEIFHPDCKSKFFTIDMQGDLFQKISLEHHLEELDEVKVLGDVKKNTTSSQEERLSQEDIEKFSGSSLGDALKNITGVSSLNTGANIVKPVIQGLNGSRVLILNNNVRMQDMEWGEEHAPNIDINANQNISVIKGAAALEYGGDAIGGVIVLNPLPIARTDSLFGKTQVNLFSNGRGGNITSEIVKSYESGLYIKAQGSLKRLGDLEAPEYILSNTGIRENNLSLNIGKRDFIQGWEAYYSFFDSDIGILRASHIGNVDDLITAINSPQPRIIEDFTYDITNPNQEVTHHLGKLNYYRRFKGLGKLSLQYDFQLNRRFEYDNRIGEDAGKPSLDLQLTTHTFSPTLQIDAKENLHLKVGLLARFQTNFPNPATGVRRLIPDYDKSDFGVFVLGDYELSDNFKIDAGLRYDFSNINAEKYYRITRWNERNYDEDFGNLITDIVGTQYLTNPVFDFHNVSAMAGFQYELNENQLLRFNYALSQRAPNPAELFSDGLHHSAARIELGDLRIKSESSSKLSASYELASKTWGLVVAPYFNAIDGFILLEPVDAELTIRGAFPLWVYRQTDALLFGIDVSLYHNWTSQLKTDHQFSWVRGTDQTTNIPMINIPAANLNNRISYVHPTFHELTVSLESQYVFEQNRFPPNITVFSPEQQQDVLLEINTPPAAYHLLSLDIGAKFSLFKPEDLSVGLRGTNLLNTNYRDYLNRLRYFVDDLGRNLSIRLIYKY